MNNRNRSESNVIVDVFHHETNENKDFLNLFFFHFYSPTLIQFSIYLYRFEWIVVCIDCYFFLLLNCLKNEAFVTHTIQPWIARKLLAE